jgi:hypothetical protein
MLFDIEADFLDEDTFTFDIENAIEDLLLDNIIIQEDGDKENKALEEDSEEETITDYQDYSDEENPITKTTLTRTMKAKRRVLGKLVCVCVRVKFTRVLFYG